MHPGDLPNESSPDHFDEGLLQFLAEFVSDHKKNRMREVLNFRTRHITLALEDIYQSQNASATMRTCECLGIQDIHIIESRNQYTLNPDVVLGASKWLSLHYYGDQQQHHASQNTSSCVQTLKDKGYQIVATSPHHENFTAETIPLDQPLALLFGTEETGLSRNALESADHYLRIPMFGFTESYNISVSVALVMNNLIHRLHKSTVPWHITESERKELLLEWYRRVIRRHEALEEEYYSRKQKPAE